MLLEQVARHGVFLRAHGREPDLFSFQVGYGFDIRGGKHPPIKRVDAASEIYRVCAADRRGDDGPAADKAQRNLSGNHRGCENGTPLNVNQIDIEAVLSNSPALRITSTMPRDATGAG